MKYTLEIEIDLPRDKVVELFDNPDNLKHWQPGFISFESLSDDPYKVGAKSKLMYDMGGRKTEMIETITAYDLPDEFSATFETEGMWNGQTNYFVKVDESTTRWISECEFKGTNFMMKAMTFFMPRAFKKQSYKFMENFKEFAEGTK